jgi:ATP/maltotriose-dependent transcriptional regulator MalT
LTPRRLERHELAATGAQLRHRTLSGRDSLTPSELPVAKMAAAGASNHTIAQTMFVSVNAIKWHLRNAYCKLDISSRDQLEDAVTRR